MSIKEIAKALLQGHVPAFLYCDTGDCDLKKGSCCGATYSVVIAQKDL